MSGLPINFQSKFLSKYKESKDEILKLTDFNKEEKEKNENKIKNSIINSISQNDSNFQLLNNQKKNIFENVKKEIEMEAMTNLNKLGTKKSKPDEDVSSKNSFKQSNSDKKSMSRQSSNQSSIMKKNSFNSIEKKKSYAEDFNSKNLNDAKEYNFNKNEQFKNYEDMQENLSGDEGFTKKSDFRKLMKREKIVKIIINFSVILTQKMKAVITKKKSNGSFFLKTHSSVCGIS